ncbi:phage tail tape measure protein [Mangrovibacter phragmitis]|uniref:phage tail tape measure protein n=1 Tax=Mangrovibacter phragmitis TaxID=1691903 RepID=UPI00336A5918
MSGDIATLSLRVNTSELEKGNQELDKFQETATGAAKKADDLNSCFRAGASDQKRNTESIKEQRQELQNLLNKISPVNRALNELDDIQASLSSYRGKGLVDVETFNRYNAILDTTRTKLAAAMEMETAEGRAKAQQALEAQKAAAAGQTFINSLQDQVNVIGKTRSEILALKAAQMGVSQQAAPFIARLREQEEQFKRGALSAGQYQQAMRYLPMQITDVVTSLASGMPIWMVAIQQGGQIKDSFGGVGNTFKALKSIITPTRLALGGLIGVATLLATAYFKGAAEADEFNKQLILTGNYAGQTAAGLSYMARSVAVNTGTTTAAASAAIAAVLATGNTASSELQKISETALSLQKTTGQGVEQTIAQFQELKKSPVEAVTRLNEQYHFLGASVYEQIAALAEQGKQQDAANLAEEAYATAMQDRAKQITENLGAIQTTWAGIKSMASSAWDAMLGIGREDPAAKLQNARTVLNTRIASSYAKDQALGDILGDMAGSLQGDLTGAQQKASDDRIKALQQINSLEQSTLSNAQRRIKAEQQITEWKNKGYISDEKAAALIKSVGDKYRDPKKTNKGVTVSSGDRAEDSSNAELLALRAQLKTLQNHVSVNDVISQQRKDLWKTEAQFEVLEDAAGKRKLSKQEQSLLASKSQVLALAQQKAILGDQIAAQEQLNKRMDTAKKYVTQMAEKQSAMTTGATMSDRLSSRQTALSQLRSGWINAGGDLTDDGYKQELKAATDYYDAEDKLRNDWSAGVKKGWSEFEDSATNVYAQFADVSKSAFTGMATQLTDFLTTGKSNFKDFLATFLKGIVQMISQLLVLKAIKSSIGGTAFGSFMGFSSGGYVPAFDSGGYTGDGGKYEPKGVVHGGEFVFTKEATKALGVGNLYSLMRSVQGYANGGYVGKTDTSHLSSASSTGVSVYAPVTIEQSSSGSGDVSSSGTMNTARQLQAIIQSTITDRLRKEMSPGGILYKK